jgi:hypothetical protein
VSLNARQLLFANSIARGDTAVSAYALAFPKANRESARSASARLAKHCGVKEEISRLRDAAQKESILSYQQKREFLAEIIQKTPIAAPRIADQLVALQIENKMSGDNYSDRDTSSSNPFQLVVNFSKNYKTLDDSAIELESGPLG